MSKQKPEKRWWVSRDRTGNDFYGIHHMVEKPKPILHDTFDSTGMTVFMKGEAFRATFTLQVKKGESKEIERPVLVLKKQTRKKR